MLQLATDDDLVGSATSDYFRWGRVKACPLVADQAAHWVAIFPKYAVSGVMPLSDE